MIVRFHDWEDGFDAALQRASAKPFEWAAWDCVHFVSDAVQAMTGVDPMADYRGEYANEADAWAALAARDGSLRAACRRVFGPSVHPSRARRGDVVLARGGKTVGVCVGKMAAFVSDDGAGLVMLPMSGMARAYPIGWPVEGSHG